MTTETKCIFCESTNTTRHGEIQSTPYGEENEFFDVPVLVDGCIDCGQQWLSGEFESDRAAGLTRAIYRQYRLLKLSQIPSATEAEQCSFEDNIRAHLDRVESRVDSALKLLTSRSGKAQLLVDDLNNRVCNLQLDLKAHIKASRDEIERSIDIVEERMNDVISGFDTKQITIDGTVADFENRQANKNAEIIKATEQNEERQHRKNRELQDQIRDLADDTDAFREWSKYKIGNLDEKTSSLNNVVFALSRNSQSNTDDDPESEQ